MGLREPQGGMRGLSVCRRGKPPVVAHQKGGHRGPPLQRWAPVRRHPLAFSTEYSRNVGGKGGMRWRKDGGEDLGPLAGGEDKKGQSSQPKPMEETGGRTHAGWIRDCYA